MHDKLESRSDRRIKKQNLFIISVFCLFAAIIFSLVSLVVWIITFKTQIPTWVEFVIYIQEFYFMAISFYIMITSVKCEILIQSLKVFCKLYISISIVSFLFLLNLSSLDSAIVIAYTAFFTAYFEALIDIDYVVKKVRISTIKFKKFIYILEEQNMPAILVKSLTVLILSIINTALPLFIIKAITTIKK